MNIFRKETTKIKNLNFYLKKNFKSKLSRKVIMKLEHKSIEMKKKNKEENQNPKVFVNVNIIFKLLARLNKGGHNY